MAGPESLIRTSFLLIIQGFVNIINKIQIKVIIAQRGIASTIFKFIIIYGGLLKAEKKVETKFEY